MTRNRCILRPTALRPKACSAGGRFFSPTRRTRMKPLASIMAITVVCAAVLYIGVAGASEPDSTTMDTTPGPAFTTVDGKITKIEGSVYTIQSELTGYQNQGSTTNVSE